jgi:hypothetical protein
MEELILDLGKALFMYLKLETLVEVYENLSIAEAY